ncbi:MAG TPA: hypothetical protein VGI31_06855, partial [Streptosporangiaceae bacterium]
LLERIAATPAEVLRGRMSLSTGEKVTVAVRSLAGMAVRPRPPHPPAAAPRMHVTPAAHSANGAHGPHSANGAHGANGAPGPHSAYGAHSAYGTRSAEAPDPSGASGASS